MLISSNESFFDKEAVDDGDYFAADYSFSNNDYKVKIRLDIERYEACVVSIVPNSNNSIDGNINKYANQNVMRRIDCGQK